MINIHYFFTIIGFIYGVKPTCVTLPQKFSPNCECAVCPLCTPIDNECQTKIEKFVLYKVDTVMLMLNFKDQTLYYEGLQNIEDLIVEKQIPIGSYYYIFELKENDLDEISKYNGELLIVY